MSFLGNEYLLHPVGHRLRDERPSHVLVHTEGGKHSYMATWKVVEAEVGRVLATEWLEDYFFPGQEVLPVGDMLLFVPDLRNGNIKRTPIRPGARFAAAVNAYHAAAAAAAPAPAAAAPAPAVPAAAAADAANAAADADAADAAVPPAAAGADEVLPVAHDAPPAMIEDSPTVNEAQVHVTARAEAAEEPQVLRAIDGADVHAAVDDTAMSSEASAAFMEPSNMPESEAGDEEPAKNKRTGAPPPQRSAQNNKRPRLGPVAVAAAVAADAADAADRPCRHPKLRHETKSVGWIRYKATGLEMQKYWHCGRCDEYYRINIAAWWCSKSCDWCVCDTCVNKFYRGRKEY